MSPLMTMVTGICAGSPAPSQPGRAVRYSVPAPGQCQRTEQVLLRRVKPVVLTIQQGGVARYPRRASSASAR